MAGTACSERKSSKVGQVLTSCPKEHGGLWHFPQAAMLLGCVVCSYGEWSSCSCRAPVAAVAPSPRQLRAVLMPAGI